MAGGTGHGGEAEVGPLPLLLVSDFGGRDLVPASGAVEDRLDDGPLLLQGMAGGKVEANVKGAYVRGISRSS
jgi:hypothetical protein